jgi:two-component system CheB/CheR fusion protein
VEVATQGKKLKVDHIYVTPSDKILSLERGKIQLKEVVEKHPILSIDKFFRSLAADLGRWAVVAILSGTGTDCTLGLKEIKERDGLVLVQSEESAGYEGMPRSAIATGLVDMILPPEKMAARLVAYFDHTHNRPYPKQPARIDTQQDWLNQIFAILRTRVGHDSSRYKLNTLLRRINRRMGVNQVDDENRYLSLLREKLSEVEALFNELLIGVTGFFRDSQSFLALEKNVLPAMIKQMPDDATFRVWVPGCSSGEEVYSLAIVLREILASIPKRIKLQLFGTDSDEQAINMAREGVYPNKLIRQSKPTKEIAGLLGVAAGTVDFHRLNIRRKLGLTNKKMNLTSYLKSII